DNAMTQFATMPTVASALSRNLGAPQFETVRNLSAALLGLQTYEFGVENVYLANIQHNWVLSNQSFGTFEDWQAGKLWSRFLNTSSTSLWLSYHDIEGDPSAEGSFPGSVYLIKKLPLNSASPLGFTLTVIPGYEVEKYLLKSSNVSNAVILDDKDQLLTTRLDFKSDNDFSPVIQKLREQSTMMGTFRADYRNSPMLVSYRKSAYNGWVYLSLTPMSDFSRASREIGVYTGIIGLVALLAAFAVSWFGSRSMYSPVRSLVQTFANIGQSTARQRKKNEFDQIHEGISRLKHSNLEMAERIKWQSYQSRLVFIVRLLEGEVGRRELEEKRDTFGLPSDWRQIQVIAVGFHSLEQTRYSEHDRDLLMFAINNIVGELLSPVHKLDPVLIHSLQVSVVGTADADCAKWKKQVTAMAENIQLTVKDVLDLPVSVGVSCPFKTLSDAPAAYGETAALLKYRMHYGEEVMISLENRKAAARKAPSLYPVQTGEKLLEAVSLGESEQAKGFLHLFMQEVLKEQVGYAEYQYALLRLLTELIRELERHGEGIQSFWKERKSLFEQFLQSGTAHEYEMWFYKQIIAPICKLMESARDRQNRTISQKVKEIIADRFDSDLTLESCAARLHYRPSYIKQIFRKETGVSFSEYLARYRLSMAKKWLVETDLKIKDISDRLKYNNPQNFIRYFRKMEGETPGNYRDKRKL
ncbi:MAG: transcriptional regulator, AraC family, partial [Paenibacillaceae bacterium]|nr:transcriptional regulator, AraC family [Paenibacillaceae bacterium]